MDIFVERLIALMEENNINQRELAKQINITEVSVSRYIKGTREPKLSSIEAIADFFHVTTDYLLGRTDDRNGKVDATLAFHKTDGYEDGLTDDEKAVVRATLDAYRKSKGKKPEGR